MRIQNKLFAYFFVFSLLLLVVSLGLVQMGFDKGMLDYVNAREARVIDSAVSRLADHYRQNGSWDELNNNHRLFRRIIESAFDESGVDRPHRPPPRHRDSRPGRRPPPDARKPSETNTDNKRQRGHSPPIVGPRHGLLDKERKLIVGSYQPDGDNQYINVQVDEDVVGYVVIKKHSDITEGYEVNFVSQLNQYLLIIGGLLMMLTALLTLPLSRHLTHPIRKITANMNNLTQGHYDELFVDKRNDELGILSRDVNELATTLKHNQSARQRWLADVSHELRTPVAILQAQIDAMLDGVRPMNKEQLSSANEELKQLQRLIDDLHELARSDIGTQHYRKADIDLLDYLPEWLERHKMELLNKGIVLELNSGVKNCLLHADPNRLQQLFDNLLSNTAKYAHKADKVDINIEQRGDQLIINIEDNGEGVSADKLPLLFDHMYRAHSEGDELVAGSGIGLAICKKIVEAHQGEITPFQSTLGGLGISIRFIRG